MRRSHRIQLVCAAAAAALLAGLAAARAGSAADRAARATPPNMVFVLTDDLSWNLVRYLPRVRALQSQG
jgi:hypothetical protein